MNIRNLANTASTAGGGTSGWLGGRCCWISYSSGSRYGCWRLDRLYCCWCRAGKVSDAVLGSFIEDDADEMVRIIQKVFEKLAVDYLLTQKEAEKSVDRLGNWMEKS